MLQPQAGAAVRFGELAFSEQRKELAKGVEVDLREGRGGQLTGQLPVLGGGPKRDIHGIAEEPERSVTMKPPLMLAKPVHEAVG
jgi:hypothetical protein